MIMGDFNAHNPLWGSDKITDKGRKVEDVISHLNLCILNNGSNIYLHPGNGSYFSIDLTIVDPSLLIDLNWSVHDDSCGSDHFPIFVNTDDRFENDSIKNRNFRKAKWIEFENLCSETILVENFENGADSIQKCRETLTNIANKCIPKTSTKSKRSKTQWFREDCIVAIKARKKAERLFNKSQTSVNLNNFRISRDKARRTINQSKRKSWKNFVSNLSSYITINKVWNEIRKIKGKGSSKYYQTLKVGNQVITNKKRHIYYRSKNVG